MNTKQTRPFRVVGPNRLVVPRTHSGGSPRNFDGLSGSKLEHLEVLKGPAERGGASYERPATAARKTRGWLLFACAVLFLVLAAIADVYLIFRMQDDLPRALQTAQSVCFLTSWERMFHPSPFDDLCRK